MQDGRGPRSGRWLRSSCCLCRYHGAAGVVTPRCALPGRPVPAVGVALLHCASLSRSEGPGQGSSEGDPVDGERGG